MKKISISDLDDLAVGATILGSGGGGDSTYNLLMAKQQLEIAGSITLVDVNELEEEALVAPIAFMGAPSVGIEKLPSGREFKALMKTVEVMTNKPVTHLMPAEIGGGNAFVPLIEAAKMGLPVIDADTTGRAFPELQMTSCSLKGISPSPAVLSDCFGNTVVLNVRNGFELERFSRKVAIEMGSSAAVSIFLMTGEEAKEAVIPGTISRAIAIGRSIRIAKEEENPPLEALLDYTEGVILGTGVITDINQSVKDGFLNGSFSVMGPDAGLKVFYQNEYLAVFRGDDPVASTPDIITLLDESTTLPVTSESLIYGLRVVLVAIPGPEIWKTFKGLELVGPQCFGYAIDFKKVQVGRSDA